MVSASKSVDPATIEARAQEVAQHHGGSRQQPVRCEPGLAAPVDLFRRKLVAKAKDQGAVADGAGKTDPIGGVGSDEHGVAGRADRLPAGRVVLAKHTGQRQHHRVAILPLDIATGFRDPAGLEQSDLQAVAVEQGLPGNLHGDIGLVPSPVLYHRDGRAGDYPARGCNNFPG